MTLLFRKTTIIDVTVVFAAMKTFRTMINAVPVKPVEICIKPYSNIRMFDGIFVFGAYSTFDVFVMELSIVVRLQQLISFGNVNKSTQYTLGDLHDSM